MTGFTLPPLSTKQSASPSLDSRKKNSADEARVPFKTFLVSPCEEREKNRGDLFSLIEEELDEEGSALAEGCVTPPFLPSAALLSLDQCVSSLSSVHTNLPVAMEHMVGTLILMHRTGETHTTLLLDQPQFASSPFFGTQITIKEFSTAPKAFNIEIISPPAALSSLHRGSEQLLSFLAKGDFGFSVHRLEIATEAYEPSSYPDQEGDGGGQHQESREDQE